jgi:hypothetical protein
MGFVLKIKHWQIFLATYVPILLINFIPFEDPFLGASITGLAGVWILLCLSTWFWVVGSNLFRESNASHKLELLMFKVSLFIPVLMILFASIVVGSYFITPDKLSYISIDIIINRLQMLYVFSFIYCAYFVAKYLKSVENNKISQFGESVPEFLLLWIFPIGIFSIQNRINKIFKSN